MEALFQIKDHKPKIANLLFLEEKKTVLTMGAAEQQCSCATEGAVAAAKTPFWGLHRTFSQLPGPSEHKEVTQPTRPRLELLCRGEKKE